VAWSTIGSGVRKYGGVSRRFVFFIFVPTRRFWSGDMAVLRVFGIDDIEPRTHSRTKSFSHSAHRLPL
jgi:hypothetical protein